MTEAISFITKNSSVTMVVKNQTQAFTVRIDLDKQKVVSAWHKFASPEEKGDSHCEFSPTGLCWCYQDRAIDVLAQDAFEKNDLPNFMHFMLPRW